MKIKQTLKIFIIILFIAASLKNAQAADLFPVFPCVEPNVNFWKKVYSEYTSRQAIIHDRHNVDTIYEIIPLSSPGGKNERKLIERTKKKYRRILRRLAYNPPVTPEERRTASLFGPEPDREALLRASSNVRFQLGQKDRFRSGLIRSGIYLDKMKQIFDDYDLPQDLIYLPHVESSFNFRAYSKSGAAGIWQFTYGTGKKFLKINQAADERLDPVRATHAAAKLLKINHEALKNWPLAITAYNHGAAGVLRAKKRKSSYKSIFKEYRSRRFKFASRNFYPEFLAAREIAKNYILYFGDLQFDPPLETREMLMKGYAPADKIAAHFNLSLRDLKRLNPALKRQVFAGRKYIPKGYRLHLPHKPKIKKLIAALPSGFFKSAPLKSRLYRVRRGDALSLIARRNSVRTRDLLLANNLSRRSVIYAGQKLIIPGAGTSAPRPEFSKSPPVKSLVYKVRRGDALERIALRRGLKTKDLLLANNLSRRSIIYPGQRLIIPGSEKLASSRKKRLTEIALTEKSLPDNPELSAAPSALNIPGVNLPGKANQNLTLKRVFKKRGKKYGVIKVAAAETLGHYADWLEVETSRIRRLNGLNYGERIKLNDRLVVPLHRVNKAEFESLRHEYRRQMEEDFLNGYKIVKFRLYKAERGDNIWELCRNDFDLPVWLIKKYNPELNLNKLKPSQAIVIPVLKKKT